MPKNIKNLIILGTIILLAIIILAILFGQKTSENGEPTFLGRLFPESETTSPSGNKLGFEKEKPSLEELGAKEAGTLTKTESQNLPAGSLIRLSSDAVSSFASFGTTTRYHKNIAENPGHLFEREADGSNEEVRISNFTVPQILNVVWSQDAKKAVIFYNLNNEVRKILVDYSEGTPKTNFLPDSVSAIAFSPDSKSIAFINSTETAENVFVANSSFSNQRKIFDNNIPNLEIFWPAQNLIALKTKSSYAAKGFLYTTNASGAGFAKITESIGLDAVWNSDGSTLVYTNSNLDLFFLDIKTGARKSLGLKTVAEKCAFSRVLLNIVYCAIPKIVSSGNYPDDWWQGKVSFEDNIIAIDTQTLDLVLFAQTQSDAVSPLVLENDNYLLFKNKNNGELWSLKLK